MLNDKYLALIAVVIVAGMPATVLAQQKTEPGKDASTPAEAESKAQVSSESATTPQSSAQPPSEAERIAGLLKSIETDKKRLEELKSKLGEQNTEFEKAAEEFRKFDEELSKQTEELKKLQDAGKTEEAKKAEATLAELQKKHKLAKERLELAVQARKTLQEQVGVLEEKLAQDQQALEKLTQPKEPKPSPQKADEQASPAPTDATQSQTAPSEPSAEQPAESAPQQPGVPGMPAAQQPAESATDAVPKTKTKETPKEVVEAEQELERTQEAAQEAEQELAEVEQRLETLSKNIGLERQALLAARKQADNAEETLQTLRAELQQRTGAGAPAAELQELRQSIQEAEQRLQNARAEARQHSLELDRLQTEQAGLLAEQVAALAKAEEERQRSEQAEKKLQALQNPFAPRNVARWLTDHGPRILFILLGAFLLHSILRIVRPRMVRVMSRGTGRGSQAERENRAHTLVGAFYNAAKIVLYVGAALMVVEAAGIPVAPLLGGAAVIGLAVAFGAQNLIKDYFYGFMILLENQYGVNDVVKIAGIAGLVERIDIRMTVLRDLEGAVHFVPHGNVTTVTNMTHGWSRALFEVGVAYKEDMDRVMAELMDLGRQLRNDPQFSDVILDDPEMLGVDAFGDSAVTVKFFIKTKPLQQWAVKRELLRRIKKRFDEIGIEIPFPHRTVYHRHEADGQREPAEHLAPAQSHKG